MLGRQFWRLNTPSIFQHQSRWASCLKISPEHSLMDQKLVVRGSDLPANTRVCLETSLKIPKERIDFHSSCSYLTDCSGCFDTGEHAPLNGSSYNGIYRSGPFWSMEAMPGTVGRLWTQDIMSSLEYNLKVRDGKTGQLLARSTVTKSYVSEGVQRIPVRHGRVRGTLFLPASTPAPSIITLYGGVNNNKVPEDRAAMLASKGYVTLALAYFGVDDLPKVYSSIDIEYFEEAIDYLLDIPEVSGKQVGLCGWSKGGDICLSIMMFLREKIGACVVQGSSYTAVPDVIKYKNKVIESSTFSPDGLALKLKGGLEELKRHPKRQIYFEHSKSPIFALAGGDDHCMPKELAEFSFYRAQESGKKNCQLTVYPQTGHLIDLPHSPHCKEASHFLLPPDKKLYFGGEKQPHALAQIKAWDDVCKFYKSYLPHN